MLFGINLVFVLLGAFCGTAIGIRLFS